MGWMVVERAHEAARASHELEAEAAHAGQGPERAFVRALIGLDRRRFVAVYRASGSRGGAPEGHGAEGAWPANRFSSVVGRDPGEVDVEGRSLIVVERSFPQPMTFDAYRGLHDRAAWCFEENDIELVESYIRRDALRSVCLFAAPDADRVLFAHRTTRVPFVRLWPARLHGQPFAETSSG